MAIVDNVKEIAAAETIANNRSNGCCFFTRVVRSQWSSRACNIFHPSQFLIFTELEIYFSKNYFKECLQSVAKYFAKNWKIKQNWTRSGNFDICFCISFDRYCQKLIFGGETGLYLVFSSNFEIFLAFPKILSL